MENGSTSIPFSVRTPSFPELSFRQHHIASSAFSSLSICIIFYHKNNIYAILNLALFIQTTVNKLYVILKHNCVLLNTKNRQKSGVTLPMEQHKGTERRESTKPLVPKF